MRNSELFSSFGAAAGEGFSAALGRHVGHKTVNLHVSALFRGISSLWHVFGVKVLYPLFTHTLSTFSTVEKACLYLWINVL